VDYKLTHIRNSSIEKQFQIFIVEHYNVRQGKQALIDFMVGKGYVSIPSLPEERKGGWAYWDCIFVKMGSGFKENRD